MKQYKLSYAMYEPSEETGDKYMAEIPALPGCCAWGDTPAETLYILEGMAEAFIQSYQERGLGLPTALVETPVQTGEVTVTA